MSDLDRQLLRSGKWQWCEGMALRGWDGHRLTVVRVSRGWVTIYDDRVSERIEPDHSVEAAPDLDHPATKGWLLAILQEATGDEFAGTTGARFPDDPHTEWIAWAHQGQIGEGSTEGEALARALLAAWGDE